MRLYLISIFLLITVNSSAQISSKFLKGRWVKTRIEFKNGQAPGDDIKTRYHYIKYEFLNANEITVCADYRFSGTKLNYDITGKFLEFKNSYGYVANTFLIEKATADSLVLLQKGLNGFDDADCLRYYFVPEVIYQQGLPIDPDDILTIRGSDTIFRQSAKFYAAYKPDEPFFTYLRNNIPEFQNVSSNTDARFVATFIVDRSGKADSLHILEGVNAAFDAQCIKAFKKARLWQQPAMHNGKAVAVQMTQTFSFSSSANFLPSFDYSTKGKAAMQRHEYDQALYFFDHALEKIPDDTENLYNRAVCKIALGNKAGACEDLMRLSV